MTTAADQLRTLIFALADDYTEAALKVNTSGLPEVYTKREITEKRDELLGLVDDLDGDLSEAKEAASEMQTSAEVMRVHADRLQDELDRLRPLNPGFIGATS